MKSRSHPLAALVLSLFLAWTAGAMAWHTAASEPEHDSPLSIAKAHGDHGGKLDKTCDHCCHAGAHTLALCAAPLLLSLAPPVPSYDDAQPRLVSRVLPPLIRPPRA